MKLKYTPSIPLRGLTRVASAWLLELPASYLGAPAFEPQSCILYLLNVATFWGIPPYSPFRSTYVSCELYLHFQGRKSVEHETRVQQVARRTTRAVRTSMVALTPSGLP
jgi:hypothetical protein